MTIQEKLKEAIESSRDVGGMFTSNIMVHDAASSCAEIVREEAIAFQQWCVKNVWQYHEKFDIYYSPNKVGVKFKSHDLYKLFQEEQAKQK